MKIEKLTLGNRTIITKPIYGWVTFNLGDFQGNLSYIEDVIWIIIEGIKQYQLTGSGGMVFDEEGSLFHIFMTKWSVFIIAEREKVELFSYDLDVEAFIEQILRDIEDNLASWCNFFVNFEGESEIETRRQYICENIDLIKKKMNKA